MSTPFSIGICSGEPLRWCRYRWRRLIRLSASPHAIAVGFSAGVFVSFTPLVGFHLLLAAAITFFMRGSLVASAFGTVVGNPLTFPLIWLSTYKFGAAIMNTEPLSIHYGASQNPGAMLQNLASMFWPMMAGGAALGLSAAVCSYGVVYLAVAAFRQRPNRMRSRQE